MPDILNFGHKDYENVELFHEIALNGSIQFLLKKLIEETERELINLNPGSDPISYHHLAIRVYARIETFQQMLQFFDKIKEEFEAKLKEGS